MKDQPVIMVATPCFGGMVGQLYMLSILKLMDRARMAGFQVTLSLLGNDALVSRARATLVGAFLDQPHATHLLFIDADISFEPDQVERLLRFDRDFVGALYPVKALDWDRLPERFANNGEPLAQAGLNYVGTFCEGADLKRDGDFATAIYAGGGFQLIRRAAIQRMVEAYPETRYTNVHAYPPSAGDNLYALFDCMIDRDSGTYLSEDYAFCRRWRAIGGEIWLDGASRLTHAGPSNFNGNYSFRAAAILGEGGESRK